MRNDFQKREEFSKGTMPARNKKNFRSTKSGAGMTRAGVKAYRRLNPGSKLKTAVTGKVKPGSKAAKATRVGKIAAGVAAAALLGKAALEKAYEKRTGKNPNGSGRRLYTDENPKDTVGIKFATEADARATVAKVKRINKPFARKIQILTVGEQRAKVMGKSKVASIFKKGKEAIRRART